jgi:Zn-dependent peptidase ImmA (M78 family)
MAAQTVSDARREGRLAAERLRNQIHRADVGWIDVFETIEDQQGVNLMFKPLRNLYGFYIRERNVAGIMINASHPVSLQRFTAAHELGHHILGHSQSMDEVASIESAIGESGAESFNASLPLREGASPGNLFEEAAAQAFAGSFLMPLGPVNHYLRAHRLGPGQFDSLEAYKFAVSFGASYDAACTQLAVLKKITWSERAILRKRKPIEVKRELTGGAVSDARSEVVFADELVGSQVMQQGDELVVALSESPSTGHVWTADAALGFEIVADELLETESGPEVLGASETRRIRFRATQPIETSLSFGLRPGWMPTSAAVSERNVEINVVEPIVDPNCAISRRELRRRLATAGRLGVM